MQDRKVLKINWSPMLDDLNDVDFIVLENEFVSHNDLYKHSINLYLAIIIINLKSIPRVTINHIIRIIKKYQRVMTMLQKYLPKEITRL